MVVLLVVAAVGLRAVEKVLGFQLELTTLFAFVSIWSFFDRRWWPRLCMFGSQLVSTVWLWEALLRCVAIDGEGSEFLSISSPASVPAGVTRGLTYMWLVHIGAGTTSSRACDNFICASSPRRQLEERSTVGGIFCYTPEPPHAAFCPVFDLERHAINVAGAWASSAITVERAHQCGIDSELHATIQWETFGDNFQPSPSSACGANRSSQSRTITFVETGVPASRHFGHCILHSKSPSGQQP